jgi:alkylated DNA repair protein alkB homolog 1
MHDSLADPRHKTNVHAHHEIPYHAADAKSSLCASPFVEGGGSKTSSLPSKKSFFNMSPKSTELFKPLSVQTHNPMKVSQFLHKKLRWLTLGLQYDWNKKIYPKSNCPPFPGGLADFTKILFPGIRPEAAIVNIYSPGDTLSVHRDVSEESGQGLVSISLGCDGIFIAGTDDEDGSNPKILAVRLRSGDAIFMCGPSRFAWHGVPQIIANAQAH